jgi:aminoglycoside 3-N-acetyltransferase I
MSIRTIRLGATDRPRAKHLFAVMADVFGEERAELSDAHVDRLLGDEDFWAMAALSGDEIIGGLTAHTLPMTRSESFEIFIYDLAVREDRWRQGIGRQLVDELLDQAAGRGIHDLFVAADNEDVHALDFYRALGGAAAPVTMFSFSRFARP